MKNFNRGVIVLYLIKDTGFVQRANILVLDNIALVFDMLGTAKSFEQANIYDFGKLNIVNVVSVLEEQGLQEIEVATMFDNDFKVHGNVIGVKSVEFKDKFDEIAKDFGFIGRLYSSTGAKSYMQTFYVFDNSVLSYSMIKDILKKYELGV